MANNGTSLPDGLFNHGDPTLLCSKTKWWGKTSLFSSLPLIVFDRTDVLIFFLTNYLIHVATVVTRPGESALSVFLAQVSALLVPFSGVGRGVTSIFRRAHNTKSSLDIAASAGALCMVIRNEDWVPCDELTYKHTVLRGPLSSDDDDQNATVSRRTRWTAQNPLHYTLYSPPWLDPEQASEDDVYVLVSHRTSVHGVVELTRGFSLAYVPRDALVVPKGESPRYGSQAKPTKSESKSQPSQMISSTYSIPKSIIAIAQIIYATITLIKASGNEVDLYGFTAFSLTVAPYTVMSLVNLLGSISTPSYEALYMVRSEVMYEAIKQGSTFDGVVGELVPEDIQAEEDRYETALVSATFQSRCSVSLNAPAVNNSNVEGESPDVTHVVTEHISALNDKSDFSTSCRASIGPEDSSAMTNGVTSTAPLKPLTVTVELHAPYTTAARILKLPDVESTNIFNFFSVRTPEQAVSEINLRSTAPLYNTEVPLDTPESINCRSHLLAVPLLPAFKRKKLWNTERLTTIPVTNTSNQYGFFDSIFTHHAFWVSLVILAIYGALSKFKVGSRTSNRDLGVTIYWLVHTLLLGPFILALVVGVSEAVAPIFWGKSAIRKAYHKARSSIRKDDFKIISPGPCATFETLLWGPVCLTAIIAPAVLIYLQVVRQMTEYGNCTRLPGT